MDDLGLVWDEEENDFMERTEDQNTYKWNKESGPNEHTEKFLAIWHKDGNYGHTWNITLDDGVIRVEEPSTGESWTAR